MSKFERKKTTLDEKRLDKIPENSDKTNKDVIRQGFSELIKSLQNVTPIFVVIKRKKCYNSDTVQVSV